MKHYNVGRGYLVLTDAAKYMANKIGKGNDEKAVNKIYKEFRNRIKEKNFEYEFLGKKIVKVKKKYLDSLVEEFRSIFSDQYDLRLTFNCNEDVMNKKDILSNKHSNILEVEESIDINSLDNLELVKSLLMGKYDDIVDEETKKKLIKRLVDN